ncbi:hypothetical protein X749_15005 [Mesorhizobium sp. LNJC391B00]|nr:hypothetical protein X749_15005 [Mesorhizobium sp. LNJC391B00]
MKTLQNSVPLHPSIKITEWQLCSCECFFIANDGVEDDEKLSCDGDDGEFLGT